MGCRIHTQAIYHHSLLFRSSRSPCSTCGGGGVHLVALERRHARAVHQAVLHGRVCQAQRARQVSSNVRALHSRMCPAVMGRQLLEHDDCMLRGGHAAVQRLQGQCQLRVHVNKVIKRLQAAAPQGDVRRDRAGHGPQGQLRPAAHVGVGQRELVVQAGRHVATQLWIIQLSGDALCAARGAARVGGRQLHCRGSSNHVLLAGRGGAAAALRGVPSEEPAA
mmetsp:Transcript_587/g.1314  ORF Transcript_587/g.1314 Transcript_587/m.1314 type:complete len:221 (-) Transcript_587:1907-2569(-)